MSRYQRILDLLKPLNPTHISLVDESHKHAGHVEHLGDQAGVGETHYQLILVSSLFDEMSRIDRQRLVNSALDSEFKAGLHAFQMKLYTPIEWANRPPQPK